MYLYIGDNVFFNSIDQFLEEFTVYCPIYCPVYWMFIIVLYIIRQIRSLLF